jgi:hypothetical protein
MGAAMAPEAVLTTRDGAAALRRSISAQVRTK